MLLMLINANVRLFRRTSCSVCLISASLAAVWSSWSLTSSLWWFHIGRSGETAALVLLREAWSLSQSSVCVCTSLTWACSSWFRLLRVLMVSSLSVRITTLSMWISLDRCLFSLLRSSHSWKSIKADVLFLLLSLSHKYFVLFEEHFNFKSDLNPLFKIRFIVS